MEGIRRFIDASKIMSIIPLPESLKNRRLEIIVLPAEDHVESAETDRKIESIVDSLIGSIPDYGMNLDDYRAERSEKYEIAD